MPAIALDWSDPGTRLAAAVAVSLASAALARRVTGARGPPPASWDVALAAAGALVMVAAAALQREPASAWSPLVDLGSFAAGASLLAVSPIGSWPRAVGALILGIHAAQLLWTNPSST